MSRRIYENADSLNKEGELIRRFLEVQYPGATYMKLPISYRLDVGIVQGGVITAFAEFKCRNIRMDLYDSFFISLSKLMILQDYASRNLVAHLVVGWTDYMGVFEPRMTDEFGIRPGGRTDRGDPADMEPMAHISIASFNVFS